MMDLNRISCPFQVASDLLGNDHRPVASTGASEGDCHIGLSLLEGLSQQKFQERSEVPKVGPGRLLPEDKTGNAPVLPRKGPEGTDKIGIREKTDVQDHVCLQGEAVAVSEGDHRNGQVPADSLLPEEGEDPVPELMNV